MPEPYPELLKARTQRLRAAVLGQPVDRVPVVLSADAFHAHRQGVSMADYVNDVVLAARTNVASTLTLGEVDCTDKLFASAKAQGASYLSEMSLPGRELAPDALWQVDEVCRLQAEDYDRILEVGWEAFYPQFMAERLPKAFADLQSFVKSDFAQAIELHLQAGIIPLVGLGAYRVPLEVLSMGRGLANFARDLYRMPDKVEQVMEVILQAEIETVRRNLRNAPQRPFAVFVAGTRSAPEFNAPRFSNRFVYPYLQRLVEAIAAEGVFSLLHFDSNWERDLEILRSLPKDACIFASDHSTDIRKVKEVLGDRMCLMGDVAATLLAIGKPEEVYDYCTGLIRDLGPTRFILGAACCVPPNAKEENVKALISAATGR